MTRETNTTGSKALARAGALAALVMVALTLAYVARDSATRGVLGEAVRKAPSDILDGDDGPTDPKVGTVPTLPGACPILGECAPPVDEASAPTEKEAFTK